MRVLLTGAAGFIGSQIAIALLGRGHEVVGVDLMLASAHGPSQAPSEGVDQLDVRDGEAMDRALRRVDVVCHQAAVVGAGVDAERRAGLRQPQRLRHRRAAGRHAPDRLPTAGPGLVDGRLRRRPLPVRKPRGRWSLPHGGVPTSTRASSTTGVR